MKLVHIVEMASTSSWLSVHNSCCRCFHYTVEGVCGDDPPHTLVWESQQAKLYLIATESLEMNFYHFLLWFWSMLKNSHYQSLFTLVFLSGLIFYFNLMLNIQHFSSWGKKLDLDNTHPVKGASMGEYDIWILIPALFHRGCQAEQFHQLPPCLCESQCLCRTLNILSSNKGQHGLVRKLTVAI